MIFERQKLLSLIDLWLGTPFSDEIAMPHMGVDCKMFCVHVYCQYLGLPVPASARFAAKQRYNDRQVVPLLVDVFGSIFKRTFAPVQIGDWLGFRLGGEGHAAIALGNGDVAHCSRRYGVCIETYSPEYWERLVYVFRAGSGGDACSH